MCLSVHRCNRSLRACSCRSALPSFVGTPRTTLGLDADEFAYPTSIAWLRACRQVFDVWTNTTRRTFCRTWFTHTVRYYCSPSTTSLVLGVLSLRTGRSSALYRCQTRVASSSLLRFCTHAHDIGWVLEVVNEVLWVVFVAFVSHGVTDSSGIGIAAI